MDSNNENAENKESNETPLNNENESNDPKVTQESSKVADGVVDERPTPVPSEKDMIDNQEMESLEPAPDMRNIRRIIAEDPEYNLATVTELETRALNQIVENFAFNASMYKTLKPRHKRLVLDKISLTIPLKVVSELIEDGVYWKRKCQDRWSLCDISHYGNSWKRLFFERNLEEIVENFIPEKTDPTCLNDTIALSAPFVERLILTQMLPPIKADPKPVKQSDDGSDNESDTEEAPKVDHLNLDSIVLKLPHLTDLRITYDVKNIGMNFEWNVFQFTVKDCQDLANCVAAAKTLKIFHLTRSRVDCDRCRLLISKLLDHPSLVELDLSHNHIGDRGARALGKMLNNRSRLEILRLTGNQIKVAGAQALAFALTKTSLLTHLDLRLNRMMDEGGQSICKALLSNNTLTHLNIAANDLSEPTAAVLANVVKRNKVLVSIDVSNNRLGPDGGKQIQEGMIDNRSLLNIDLRFTDCGDEAVFSITQIVSFNQKVKMYEQENDKEIKDASEFIIHDLKYAIFSEDNFKSAPSNNTSVAPSSKDTKSRKGRSIKSSNTERRTDTELDDPSIKMGSGSTMPLNALVSAHTPKQDDVTPVA